MAIGITQGALDHFAEQMMALLPTHPVTYRHRPSGATQVDSIPVDVHWRSYTQKEKGANPLLVNAREYRIVRTALPFTPLHKDILTHENGESWEAGKDITGGPVVSGYWRLMCTQVR